MLISFCTVCKNRSDHFKQTIIKNIKDHEGCKEVEFILLDYNSKDDLEEWVSNNLFAYIESGLFSFYKTYDPQFFHRSHSRNMAFRLASGDLICNIDADNFTGPCFSTYLADQMKDGNSFVCAGGNYDNLTRPDIGGRICFKESDFWRIGGFDEEMVNYGFEDYDLINRLEMLPLKKRLIKDERYLNVINHPLKTRIKDEFPFRNFKEAFVHYINPSESILILFFSDNTFAFGNLINSKNLNSDNRSYRFSRNHNKVIINDNRWITGSLNFSNSGQITLENSSQNFLYHLTPKDENGDVMLNTLGTEIFYKLTDDKYNNAAILFYSETFNRLKMERNVIERNVHPNNGPIGCGTVFKNFDYQNPIILK